MTHFLGFEHTIGGIAGQVFGGVATPVGDLPGWGGITSQVGSGFGWNPTTPAVVTPSVTLPATVAAAANGGSMSTECAPSRKTLGTLYRNEDGTVCLKPYKTRKRRRRLATASDISDLSALKTVLSSAQVNTWLATRGRR